jgi:hypothetical protein
MPAQLNLGWKSAVLTLLAAWLMPLSAAATTPDNPRVQSSVRKALEYLETAEDGRVGGKALVGLAFAKHGKDADHPQIKAAISAIKAALRNGPEGFRPGVYDTGISIMFLVAVDPSRYRFEIESLVRSLHLRQKDHGAWGYPLTHDKHAGTCDTSMTQYAVLGLWEAEDQAGVETPRLVWDRVARWLLLTQDPGGGFGYQGLPALRLGRFEKQSGIRDSMTLAAVGSLYVVKDRVGITKLKKATHDDTPDEFVPFESREQRAARIKTAIDLRHFARALANGNRWIEDNVDVQNLTGYSHYALYALERYESLREAQAAGRSHPLEKTDESKWYNRGARYLMRTQHVDGSWEGKSGVVPATAFGALFLMGSTRKTLAAKSVARYTSSSLVGGKGLPQGKKLRVREGRVVHPPLARPLPEVLDILSDTKHPEFKPAIEAFADAAREESPSELALHLDAIIPLAVAPSTSEAQRGVRMLAIDCLRRARDLDRVPWLIHLLEDDDPRVAYAAAEALGKISRKYDTGGLSRRCTVEERKAAVAKWSAWYRSLRPDVDLDSFSFLRPARDE